MRLEELFDYLSNYANNELEKIRQNNQKNERLKNFDEIKKEWFSNDGVGYESVIHNNYSRIIELLDDETQRQRFKTCVDKLLVFEKVGLLGQSFPQLEEVRIEITSIFNELSAILQDGIEKKARDAGFYESVLTQLENFRRGKNPTNLSMFKKVIDELEVPFSTKNEMVVALINYRITYEKEKHLKKDHAGYELESENLKDDKESLGKFLSERKLDVNDGGLKKEDEVNEQEQEILKGYQETLNELLNRSRLIINDSGMTEAELKRLQMAYAGMSAEDYNLLDEKLKKRILLSKIYTMYDLLSNEFNNGEDAIDFINELESYLTDYDKLAKPITQATDPLDNVAYLDDSYLDKFIFLENETGEQFFKLGIKGASNPTQAKEKLDVLLKELSFNFNRSNRPLLGSPIMARVYVKSTKDGNSATLIGISMGNEMLVVNAGDNYDKVINDAIKIISENVHKIKNIMKKGYQNNASEGGVKL